MIAIFGSAGSLRAERRCASRQACNHVHPLLIPDTTRHLFIEGPADALERAEAFWRAELAVGAFGGRRPGMDIPLSPHRPGLWLPVGSVGERVQRAPAFQALEPALDIRLVWYDGALDYGETVLFRGGAVPGHSDGGYQQLYRETCGEPDHGHDPHGIRVHERLAGGVVPIARVRA